MITYSSKILILDEILNFPLTWLIINIPILSIFAHDTLLSYATLALNSLLWGFVIFKIYKFFNSKTSQ